MHRTTVTLLSAACLALAGCSSSGDNSEPAAKPSPSASAEPAAAPTPERLEPVWAPKLKAAAGEDGEAISACQQPSSNACARYLRDIMQVVHGLKAAIDATGRPYKASTEQIAKMRDAEAEYKANGCQGDPTAEDPNSQCHGVVNVTLGATTLQITLSTDEMGM